MIVAEWEGIIEPTETSLEDVRRNRCMFRMNNWRYLRAYVPCVSFLENTMHNVCKLCRVQIFVNLPYTCRIPLSWNSKRKGWMSAPGFYSTLVIRIIAWKVTNSIINGDKTKIQQKASTSQVSESTSNPHCPNRFKNFRIEEIQERHLMTVRCLQALKFQIQSEYNCEDLKYLHSSVL